MIPWKLFVVLGLAVGAASCHDQDRHSEKPEILCKLDVYPEISEEVLEHVEACNVITTCYDASCGLAQLLDKFSNRNRIQSLRQRAPNAKILRQVEVHLDEDYDPERAVQSVEASLAEGIYDGVELVLDSAQLDQPEQVKFAQFLVLLRRSLDENLLIANSFVCSEHLPESLLNAMIESLDYVILVPSSQHPSAEGSVFVPRIYSDSVANCLLNANFPRSKIVLGLPTGGQLVDPSADRESPSSLIPYGNVCELHDEQQQHCEKLENRDCSLFEDGVKLVYDDPNSAGGRALQCVGCRLKGISIGLSYDDSAGICVGSSFPLLAAIQNVFEHRSGVIGFHGCPSDPYDSEESGSHEHGSDCSCADRSDSSEEGDCCDNCGKSCNGCKLLNRLQCAVKTSEHVVGVSKSIADRVLDALDKVVSLVSSMLGQQPEQPNSEGGDPQASIPLNLNINPPAIASPSPLDSAVSSVNNVLNGPDNSALSLGIGAQNPALPFAPILNVSLSNAALDLSPLSQPGLVPRVIDTVHQTVNSALGSPPVVVVPPISPAVNNLLPPAVVPNSLSNPPAPTAPSLTESIQKTVDAVMSSPSVSLGLPPLFKRDSSSSSSSGLKKQHKTNRRQRKHAAGQAMQHRVNGTQ